MLCLLVSPLYSHPNDIVEDSTFIGKHQNVSYKFKFKIQEVKIKRKCIRSKVQIRAPQFRLIIQNDLKVGKIKQLMLILHTHTERKKIP